MRQVPSPTTRMMVIGLLTALAASFSLAKPAQAATPAAPGSFTGYGFDACVAPSQKVMDAWNLRSPFSAIGIYVSGNSRYCSDQYQPNLSKAWVAKNASNGWRFIPIHVGYQAPCFVNNSSSRVQKKRMSTNISTARRQARADVRETVAALQKYGFGKGSVSYLDIEWYKRTKACDTVVRQFADAWTESLHAKGYKSGVYSSGSAAIAMIDENRNTSGFTIPDHLWIAWTNKKADTDGGPFLGDSGWADHQRIHQYENGVNVTYGGHTVNIDRNYLDVGRGSRATKQPMTCGVPMSFTSYPRLEVGDRGPEVAALQCLLRERGFKRSVGEPFGSGTRKALDAYRASLGWKAAGHTTVPTWTALLSAGRTPRVLKQGSVGAPVWRLQRALVAQGLSVRITGVYDSRTAAAVKAYRSAHKLTRYTTTESSVWALLQRGKTAR